MEEHKDNDDVTINNNEDEDMHSSNAHHKQQQNGAFKGVGEDDKESLYVAILSLLRPIFFPDHNSYSSTNIFNRTKDSLRDNLPHLRDASRTAGSNLLMWARKGTPLRLLLVLSVGTIALLALSGILVFALFLATATINAVILSIFMSLAAAGGFLAIFFACLAAIYIGALSVAVFVIFSVTIAASIAVLIVTVCRIIVYSGILLSTQFQDLAMRKHIVAVDAGVSFARKERDEAKKEVRALAEKLDALEKELARIKQERD